MASKAIIPITDHNTGDICTSYYAIRLKLASEDNWQDMDNQYGQMAGSPAGWAVVLTNLIGDVTYDYEITRYCCPENGGESTSSVAATGSFLTTP